MLNHSLAQARGAIVEGENDQDGVAALNSEFHPQLCAFRNAGIWLAVM